MKSNKWAYAKLNISGEARSYRFYVDKDTPHPKTGIYSLIAEYYGHGKWRKLRNMNRKHELLKLVEADHLDGGTVTASS